MTKLEEVLNKEYEKENEACYNLLYGVKKKHKKTSIKARKYKDKSCQVCGFDSVIDIHHEGNYIYILCPNHHALITRHKESVATYKIQPINTTVGETVVYKYLDIKGYGEK